MDHDERQRQEPISQYRTLLETSTDGFFINVAGRFRYVNPAFQRLLGAASADQLLGRLVFDVIHPSSHEAVRARIEAMKSSVAPVAPLEETYVRLDGSPVDVEVTAVAIVHDAEHAMLVTVRDITDRTQAQRARLELEEQLRQAQKMEALGTLAGGVAHDFNNILAAIMGNAEVLRMRVGSDARVRGQLEAILAAVERAKGLTRQVLSFSRHEPPRLQVLDLSEVVREELSLLRAALPVGATIREALDPGPSPVMANPTQMHQVLLNLCTNAWQSFGGGAGTVTVGLSRCVLPAEAPIPAGAPAGPYVVLSVQDDGPGFDDDVAARVFDPFFTTKAPGEGTGLGLSVVHGIARAHGAHIVCHSQRGLGTTFRLFVPLVSAEQAAVEAQPVAAPSGRGAHVLYLDDEPMLVQVARDLLTARGYRVSGFTSPHEALDALRADPRAFDVLVTDLKMPTCTGLEVARALREFEPGLPIILITGYLDDAVGWKTEELGIRCVLSKPATVEDICFAITSALTPT